MSCNTVQIPASPLFGVENHSIIGSLAMKDNFKVHMDQR